MPRTLSVITKPSRRRDLMFQVGLYLLAILVALFWGLGLPLLGGIFPFLIGISLMFSSVILVNYRFGVWLLVFLMPLSATTIFPHELLGITGLNPFNLLFLVTLLSFALHTAWGGKFAPYFGFPSIWWAYLIPITIAAVMGMRHVGEIPEFAYTEELVRYHNATGYLRDVLIKPLTYVIVALLVGAAVRDKMKPEWLVGAFALSILAFSAWIFFYIVYLHLGLSLLSEGTARSLLTGTGMHANEIGPHAAFGFILCIFMLAENPSGFLKPLLWIATAAATLLVLVSFSRGGMLTLIVGFAWFLFQQRKLSVLFFALLIAIATVPFLPDEVYERMSVGLGNNAGMIGSYNNDTLTAGRVAGVWLPQLPDFFASPLIGKGLDSTLWSNALREGSITIVSANPHNLYLKILLNTGIAGLIVFGLFFRDLWRRFTALAQYETQPSVVRGLANGARAALISFLALGTSNGDFMPDPISFFIWLAIGFLVGTSGKHNQP